jgi:ADP-ribosylglycohydrolase
MSKGGTPTLGERILGGLWGSLVGDALGVPVEFTDRATLRTNPVTDMREFGSHNQPRGTWSDDGALLLCTVDSLVNHEFDTQDLGKRFVEWMRHDLWTARGEVFDVGRTTSSALIRIGKGVHAENAGSTDEDGNGNGSLMRILPVALRFAAEPIDTFANRLERASSLTHGHPRSRMACVFYGLVARSLLFGHEPNAALAVARVDFVALYSRSEEIKYFQRLLGEEFRDLPEEHVMSTGYVLHTLHASLWCLLKATNFRECVLKAVNLAGDADTAGCVAGGLAGVAFGKPSIPPDWIRVLARPGDVDCLTQEFATLCEESAMKAPG